MTNFLIGLLVGSWITVALVAFVEIKERNTK